MLEGDLGGLLSHGLDEYGGGVSQMYGGGRFSNECFRALKNKGNEAGKIRSYREQFHCNFLIDFNKEP